MAESTPSIAPITRHETTRDSFVETAISTTPESESPASRPKIDPRLEREYTIIGVGTIPEGHQLALLQFRPASIQPPPQISKVDGRTVLEFGAENTAGATQNERFAINNNQVAKLLGIDLSQLSPQAAVQKLKEFSELLGMDEPKDASLFMTLRYTTEDGKDHTAFIPLYDYDPNRDLESIRGRGSLGTNGIGAGLDYQRNRVDGSGYRVGANGGINGNGASVGASGATWWRDGSATHSVSVGAGVSPSGPFGGAQYSTTQFDKYGQFEQRYGVDAGIRASGPSVRLRYENRDLSIDAGVNSLGGLPLTGVLVRTAGETPAVLQSTPNRQWATPNGKAPITAGIVAVPGVPAAVPFIVPQMYAKEISMTQQEAEAAEVRQISQQVLGWHEKNFDQGLSKRVMGYVQRYMAQSEGMGTVEFPPATIGAHVLPVNEYGSGRFSTVIKNFEEATGITIVRDGKVVATKEEVQGKLQEWFINRNSGLWISLSEAEQRDVKELIKRHVEPLPVPTFQQLQEEVNKGIREESYRQRYVGSFEVDGKVKIKEEQGKDGVMYAVVRTSIGLGLGGEVQPGRGGSDANMQWYTKERRLPLSPDLRVAQQELQSFERKAEEEKRFVMNRAYDLLSRSVNGRTDLTHTFSTLTTDLQSSGFVR